MQDLARLLRSGNVEQHRDVLERPQAAAALAGALAWYGAQISAVMRAKQACASVHHFTSRGGRQLLSQALKQGPRACNNISWAMVITFTLGRLLEHWKETARIIINCSKEAYQSYCEAMTYLHHPHHVHST